MAFVVCGAMVWFFLPSMRKEPKVATGVLRHRVVTVVTPCSLYYLHG